MQEKYVVTFQTNVATKCKSEGRSIVLIFKYSVATQHEKSYKETLEICCDIEIIVTTKQKTEDKKIVAIYDNSVMTKTRQFVKTF